jgi:protein phosphatase
MEHQTVQMGEVLTVVNKQKNVRLSSTALSSTGQVRTNNEDSVKLWALDDVLLGLVADGMGGAAGGEEASRLAVETVQSDFVESTPDSKSLHEQLEEQLASSLRHVLNQANRVVLDKATEDYELAGMGTTATMVLIRGTEAIFAHIGDSRAYLIDGETHAISQITEDHSFVEALVASGHITPEQAAVHPLKNVLYRALGQKEEAESDVDIYFCKLKIGDRLVLCSDGLPRHLKDEEIGDIINQTPTTDVAAQKLIDLANERGGEDNITVLIVAVQDNA